MSTKEANTKDHVGLAAGRLNNVTKRAIGMQTEVWKRLFDIYWHCSLRIQEESTQVADFLGKLTNAASAVDQVGILQVWMKGARERVARDAIYSIESAKSLANVELAPFASAWLSPLPPLNFLAGRDVTFRFGSWQFPTLRIEGGRPAG
ncbi:hypothetical protein ACVW1A_000011 [Bradyrhizobium sp. LB1.3]